MRRIAITKELAQRRAELESEGYVVSLLASFALLEAGCCCNATFKFVSAWIEQVVVLQHRCCLLSDHARSCIQDQHVHVIVLAGLGESQRQC